MERFPSRAQAEYRIFVTVLSWDADVVFTLAQTVPPCSRSQVGVSQLLIAHMKAAGHRNPCAVLVLLVLHHGDLTTRSLHLF